MMIRVVSTAAQTSDRSRWIALVVVCMGQLMSVLDTTIVNVALPSIQRDLGFSQANLTWVVNAYLITFGSFLLLAGRLGDLIGRRRVFLTGVAVFTAASAACGFANSQGLLVAARFVQGLGGAAAASTIVAIIATEFPKPSERAKAMSVYTFVISGGGSLGLVLGGLLTQSINWHWIFFINVPIGVLTFVAGRARLIENEGLGIGRDVDVLGSVIVTVAIMLGVYAIVTSADHGWGSAHTIGFGAVAVALLAGFLLLESRLRNPIMPLRIFRVPGLALSSGIRSFLVTGMFASFFIGVLYLEHIKGFGVLETGLAFLPMTLVLAGLSSGITARLVASFGPRRTALVGLAFAIASLLMLSQASAGASYFPYVFVAFVLLGLGAGLAFLPLLLIAMAEVPAADAGLASGIINVSLQIAGALGLAVLGTLATDHTKSLAADGHSHVGALLGGYHLAFLVGAIAVGVGLLVSILALRDPGRPRAAQAPVAEPEAA